MKRNTITCSESLAYAQTLANASVHCIVTSPPYFGLRDYSTGTWEGGDPECDHKVREDPHAESSTLDGGKGTVGHSKEGFKDVCPRCGAIRKDEQLGLEQTPEAYIERLVIIFREYRRVLRDDGTLWIVIGDSYCGSWGNYMPTGKGGQRPKSKERWERPAYEGSESWRPPTSYKLPGLKEKDLMMIPARLAIALCNDGWFLRQEIVWAKKNGMPESVQDRCTRSHEMIYMLAKKPRYWYDAEAIKQPSVSDHPSGNGYKRPPRQSYQNGDGTPRGNDEPWEVQPMANCRSVWEIATASGMAGHYATFPPKLAERMILAGCPHKTCSQCGAPWVRILERGRPIRDGGNVGVSVTHADGPMDRGGKGQWDEGHMPMSRPTQTVGWKPTCKCETTETVPGIVIDPFMGSGTVALVARRLGRDYLGCDLNPEYVKMADGRLAVPYTLPMMEVLQA